MTKKLARLLRADIQETSDLKSIAKMLANKGRGNDTLLAHITPREVKILKAAGGSGTVNPDTGLMEFDDSFGDYSIPETYSSGADYAASIPNYIQPRQEGDLTAKTEFDLAARQSPYYGEYGGTLTPSSPQPLTSPEISNPEQYYSNQELQQLQNAAIQQYAGAVPFAYEPATPGSETNIFQTNEEFPPGMTARPDLFAAQRAAQAAQSDVALSPEAAKAQKEQAAAEGGKTPPSLATRAGDVLSAIGAGGKNVLNFLEQYPQLAKAGAAGAGALLTAKQAKQGAQQVQEATTQQKALAAPYQAQGAEFQRAAMAGELTPQSAQAYQAMRAQLAQGVEARGGVGVAQAQAQLENTRQALLQQQADYGIKLSSIGDNIAIGAIRTGLQADQAVNQLTNSMYSNMFAIASGLSPQTTRTATTQGV